MDLSELIETSEMLVKMAEKLVDELVEGAMTNMKKDEVTQEVDLTEEEWAVARIGAAYGVREVFQLMANNNLKLVKKE